MESNSPNYENIHEIHENNLNSYLIKKKKLNSKLLQDIDSIKLKLRNLIEKKNSILSSLCNEERDLLTSTINDLTDSFNDLDVLINHLQKTTCDYDFEVSKYLTLATSTDNSLTHEETQEILSNHILEVSCTNCSMKFTSKDPCEVCPYCGAILR